MGYNIAIIGSGIAGLSAAWLLGRRHQITLYERKPEYGLGSDGHPMDPRGAFRMDLPPRVTNRFHYPNLFRLLDDANIETYEVAQKPSFSRLDGSMYLGFFEAFVGRRSFSLPKASGAVGPWIKAHGLELGKFYKLLRMPIPSQAGEFSFGPYLEQLGFSEDFRVGFVYPICSLICTCPFEMVEAYPADDLLLVLKNFTGSVVSRRFTGGTRAVESKLKEYVGKVYFNRNVVEVTSEQDGVTVKDQEERIKYDHVIVATGAPQAWGLLSQKAPEREFLSKIPVTETEMVLHRDERLMPLKTGDWSPVNYTIDFAHGRSAATVWMNKLDDLDLGSENLFQTLTPVVEPREELVLKRATFERSVVTAQSKKAMREFRQLLGHHQGRRLWFVGAYLPDGVPLLENGVASAYWVQDLITRQVSG